MDNVIYHLNAAMTCHKMYTDTRERGYPCAIELERMHGDMSVHMKEAGHQLELEHRRTNNDEVLRLIELTHQAHRNMMYNRPGIARNMLTALIHEVTHVAKRIH